MVKLLMTKPYIRPSFTLSSCLVLNAVKKSICPGWNMSHVGAIKHWTKSSYIPQVQDIETCVFSLSDIKKLLSQWLADEKGISLRPNMTVFASRILSASGGHIGLTGLLCDRLARLARECISSLQLKNFDNLIKKSMSEAVWFNGMWQRIRLERQNLSLGAQKLLDEVIALLHSPHSLAHQKAVENASD